MSGDIPRIYNQTLDLILTIFSFLPSLLPFFFFFRENTLTKPNPLGISVVTDILPEISNTNTTNASLGPCSEIFGGAALIT